MIIGFTASIDDSINDELPPSKSIAVPKWFAVSTFVNVAFLIVMLPLAYIAPPAFHDDLVLLNLESLTVAVTLAKYSVPPVVVASQLLNVTLLIVALRESTQ